MKSAKDMLSSSLHQLKNVWKHGQLRLQTYVSQSGAELPLRADLYSALQMEQHGRILANSHKLSTVFGQDQLLARLADNQDVIMNACTLLTEAIKEGRPVTPAAAWLLDNYYLIEEQIRTAKRHLPKNYSKELPRLLRGNSAGRPRVYDIALETISHGDGRVDPENLSRFISAYQLVSVLKLGELWAIPIMLRLALIENLRRVATNLTTTHNNRNLAAKWAEEMTETAEKDPSNLILLVADMSRSKPPLDSSFVAEMMRRLQGQGPALALPLNWLSQRLAETGDTIEHLVHLDSQHQAADQISISNSIGSLRLLTSMDWRDFVESMSVVDRCLREDPAAIYTRMDFSTRDLYRHAVEKIAKGSGFSEADVAHNALRFAREAANKYGQDARSAHIGYFLIGKGRVELERSTAMQHALPESIKHAIRDSALSIYLGSIVIISLATTGLLLKQVRYADVNPYLLAGFIAASLIASSQFALSMVNWLATFVALPRPLPRMDFSKGIPLEASTLVVVPTMLFNVQNIDALSEAMEVRFLANSDANLRFCLLTDFPDAATETLETDEGLLDHISNITEALNTKYPRPDGDHFIIMHRPRVWNAQEKIWMAYERKRGKLAALNSYLRGTGADAFMRIIGNTAGLENMKYVITLDTDTELPRDAARKFVATMAHPLNRAYYDDKLHRVTDGYGILQPRVAVSLPASDASYYELLCGGEAGIDPYTRSVSDVYQDVFDEGSFIGKGIYDIDVFEHALKDRMPENRILSHDLLEGCYARAGLLSDVQLYEEYPSSYLADIRRRHRWIRGDWQIASWLLPKVPGPKDEVTGKPIKRANSLSSLSHWKLFDNLRRSLVPLALVAFLVIAWSGLPHAWLWSAAALGFLLIPAASGFVFNLTQKPDDVFFRQHLLSLLRSSTQHFIHASLSLVFLPYEAWINLDAILRTQWRVLISHRRLLEWNPSTISNHQFKNTVWNNIRSMWIAPVFSVAVFFFLDYVNPVALRAAAPILLLWLISPVIAYLMSREKQQRVSQLSTEQTEFLQATARKTWLFFETYVGPEDNWLPPDNVQFQPVSVTAHRTSPTNIGLSLLANLVAYDFGYIPAGQLLQRTQDTFASLSKMERHQDHFYNWYDTKTLQPLQPLYISTVDSGNLAGHLLTLRPGLAGLTDAPICQPRLFGGLHDTYLILRNTVGEHAAGRLAEFKTDLDVLCLSAPTSLIVIYDCLKRLTYHADSYLASQTVVADNQSHVWASALSRQTHAQLDELVYLAPWLTLPEPGSWLQAFPQLDAIPTLKILAQLGYSHNSPRDDSLSLDQPNLAGNKNPTLAAMLTTASKRATDRIQQIGQLVQQTGEFARMEYEFLYDANTHLLTIGYNVNERRRDVACYDLLASEARLATFVAIAQGQIPQESWFALGRQLTIAGGEPILLSWSGSMFEYLMPLLVMPNFQNTLLEQTYRSVVQRQIEYGEQRNVPWGISESGYNTFDAQLNYQYRAFGVPGLGFKRGLGDDLVIAPYASMMALMVEPEKACSNLEQLASLGFEGVYGFFEAIDYTPSRLPRGQTHALIRSFMVHHQGMGFLSLAYLLLDKPLQKRFESDPLFQATMSLLHERVPKATAVYSNTTELADIRSASAGQETPLRVLHHVNTRTPEVQLLSNGRYHVMISSVGGSYSRWNDLAITRWNEDSTRDHWGTFCYVRDTSNGKYWSTAFQPCLVPSASYEVIFSEGRAEFRRSDNNLDMHTEIVVSPEDDIELRRTRITNRSRHRRTIDFTSYAEVVLAPAAADAMHPAFSKLFVQTEILHDQHAIVCTRRPRSMDEKIPSMFHLISLHGATADNVSYETDRAQFIGRGNTLEAPAAMRVERLSDSQGSVLDPVVAIRYQITLEPEQIATFDVVTGVAENRDLCLALIDKYQDQHLADRVIGLSWTHSQIVLRQLNISEADAQLYGRMANSVIYMNPLLRADASVLSRNHRGQSGLWGYAISGDLPIVLLQINQQEHIELVRQLVQAHAYWRSKGLAVDLVIWNEDHATYRQALQEQIMGMISSVIGTHAIERPGGIFVRMAEQISVEDKILFQAVARVILNDHRGSLMEQLSRRDVLDLRVPKLLPSRQVYSQSGYQSLTNKSGDNRNNGNLPEKLQSFNGIGGFSENGREYVITTREGQVTPAPWVNVLANPQFGTVISESGQAYTWGENAHEFRLTPWNNDPVSDSSGEAFYIRDEDTGAYWSPTALPCRGSGDYVTRHGFGYSVFTHEEQGIRSELTVFVSMDTAAKYSILRVTNVSEEQRKLSATGYVEWVLGDLRPKSLMHIATEIDPASGCVLARNPYNTEFPGRRAFFDLDGGNRSVTGDRNEFIGRNGSLQKPAALERQRLSGKTGAGLDPCAAIQQEFELSPGQEKRLVFVLGTVMTDHTNVTQFIQQHRGIAAAEQALNKVHDYWRDTLGVVQVNTPDQELNLLANGWLLYQTIACRLWARSGYYQSGGAFGFRDQLQDSMALVHTRQTLAREQLLLSAAHQFVEGDVQHWWHPPIGRGVRTHCSDDYLWLPLAVARYVNSSGDIGILDEELHYLEGRLVNQEEDSYYDLPGRSPHTGSLYQHCVKAIENGLRFGSHGLPLIGSCDWNDGMDKVGHLGKGESVWLAFFLHQVLTKFSAIALARNDNEFSSRCLEQARQLAKNIDDNAWDGAWYRRAYFDDGGALGSAQNAECQIDSISQSWAILSGATNPQRAHQAMQSLDKRLMRRDKQIIQLLDPAFDCSGQNPGYIRGYVPGVRENGGQYTHAAIWTGMAFAKMGDAARAWEAFDMINPIHHGNSPESVARYKVEPYVICADVYAVAPHTGRGGWSWYTGSAGWMYTFMMESLLGLKREGKHLSLTPCVPEGWTNFSLRYQHLSSTYLITVKLRDVAYGQSLLFIDEVAMGDLLIPLLDDQREHTVELNYVKPVQQ
ncbi:GH36-type glycosyl hydrolase domain-containing protein [Undibacterium sp. TC4M20W]|uniref:GH36-type glycosyl hydrolase domain-containing protein n=1 Tax=Undibacterium sp. TC4M20W TaxID=3413052 RepID=UPI003BF24AB3